MLSSNKTSSMEFGIGFRFSLEWSTWGGVFNLKLSMNNHVIINSLSFQVFFENKDQRRFLRARS
jgi:hypothetical protein